MTRVSNAESGLTVQEEVQFMASLGKFRLGSLQNTGSMNAVHKFMSVSACSKSPACPAAMRTPQTSTQSAKHCIGARSPWSGLLTASPLLLAHVAWKRGW